jgi:transposase
VHVSSPEDPTPPRPSRTLEVFEKTCQECLQKLDDLGLDLEGRTLRHEAVELITMLQAWRTIPPSDDDRVTIINRVMKLHRSLCEYLA